MRKHASPVTPRESSAANRRRLVIPPDTDATFRIVRSRKRPLSKAALHGRAGDPVADLIWATCHWGRDWTLGDYRFLVFATDPSEGVNLYVQFWSEPQEEVCWEVCSGTWNPPADQVMAGAPSEYVRRLGFEIGGEAENFQRHLWIRRRRDAEQAARVVLDIFYDAFAYRGLTPMDVQLVSASHGELQRVFNAFGPEDLVKTAKRLGWTPHIREAGGDDDEGPVVIGVQRGDARASLVLSSRVPGTDTYQSAFVDIGEPLAPDQAAAHAAVAGPGALREAPMRMGRTLQFAGGVTADWLLTQVAAGLDLVETIRPTRLRTVH